MGLLKKGWRLFKSNPIIYGLFIVIILMGIILIAMLSIFGFSKESGTEIVEGSQSGFGYGHEIGPGDIIEVEYDIDGEDVDVYIVKGYSLPFYETDEDVLFVRHNTNSGTIKYTAKEKGMHMVFFKGYDFTVSYTYKVTKPLFTIFIIVVGLILIASGIGGIWYFAKLPNPKYLGNYMKYIPVFFIPSGIILLIIGLTSFPDAFSLKIIPTLWIIFGIEYLFLAKVYDGNYSIRTELDPDETAEKIKGLLEEKELKYQERKFVREVFLWYIIIDLDKADIRIKIKGLLFQRLKTGVLIGKQNKLNKIRIISLANDIAKALGCENYKPISIYEKNDIKSFKENLLWRM